MAIDRELIEEIKSRADIVDIISSYISVSKKGRNYFAICPFHDDHNPSLSINKEKNIFKCFVCGTSGDVFGFVSKYEHISYEEAIRKVASMINFDDPRLFEKTYTRHIDENVATLYKCINELQKFYEYSLLTSEGKIASEYLENRNISKEEIEKFSIGYSPSNPELATDYLLKKGFSNKNIEDIGVGYWKSGKIYDKNAGRLIFPIKDTSGQIVGFSARRLVDDDSPKYVNTPETKIFSKGNVFYNMYNAKQSLKHDSYLYIVEGFMDVFALDKIGIHSVVGLMGTAMTKTHVEQLRRLNVEIRLCLDNDNAGQIAMMKIMSMFDERGISYRLVSKVDEKYKDADEIIKIEGEEQLRLYVNSLVDPFNFALSFYENISPLGSIEDRKKVIKHFAPMLVNANSKLEFNDYIYKLAKVTQFDATAIKDFVDDYKKHQFSNESTQEIVFTGESKLSKQKVARELRRLFMAERLVLTNMLFHKEAVKFYENNVKYFYNEVYRQIANFIVEYVSNNEFVDLTSIIDSIMISNLNDKDKIVNEVTSLGFDVDSTSLYDKSVMDDCLKVIDEERQKLYERTTLEKALEGKSAEEQARLLSDYIKRTNKQNTGK